MVGWVGDQKTKKKQKKQNRIKANKNRHFQNPRVSSDLPKYPKTKFLTKIRNFQNRQKLNFGSKIEPHAAEF